MKKFEQIEIKFWHFVVTIILFIVLVNVTEHHTYSKIPNLDEADIYVEELDSINSSGMLTSPVSFVLFYEEDFKWCDIMVYNLNSLAKAKFSEANFYKVNLSEHPEYILGYNISGTPNILVFKNDVEIKRIMGVVSTPNLKRIYHRIEKDEKFIPR